MSDSPANVLSQGRALRSFFRIAQAWHLSHDEARALLGSPPEPTYWAWQRGKAERISGDILRRINRALGCPPYNLLIHTAPIVESATDFYHWHVEIIPKLTKVAGFEWGSGFYINPTAPEEAAEVLREVVV